MNWDGINVAGGFPFGTEKTKGVKIDTVNQPNIKWGHSSVM